MGKKQDQEAAHVEREESQLTAAQRRAIEQTGAIEVAARLGNPVPARVGDRDEHIAEWVCRLLAIGYGFQTPGLLAYRLLGNDVDREPGVTLDRAEKRLRSLAAMILVDDLGWSNDQTGLAFGTTGNKAQKWARRGRKWAEHPKAESAVHHVAGYVVAKVGDASKPRRSRRARNSPDGGVSAS